MESKGSLLCLQEPTTSPYPEPYESNPHPPTHPASLESILMLYSHLHVVLLSGLTD
jgi:hypothetical protein